tara:strand:- start:132 stop:833 length:702 start_codon:yes stop_codon:yes gene_type:complete
MTWLNYWNKKNLWSNSDIWKKNNEIFFKKTSKIFNYNNTHTVLDIGCGKGDFAKKISDKVNLVYCLDTSEEFISICKNNLGSANNVKILKLNSDYTNLSLLKDIKFSIIIANSVVQYYKSQEEIVELVKSVKKIAINNAYFLISDIEVSKNKKKSYYQLIYNSIIGGYFFSLVKIGIKLLFNKEYTNAMKQQPILVVDLEKLIKDIVPLVKKVSTVSENLTVNIDRKHLLIKF